MHTNQPPRTRLRRILQSTRGAFDLPSILVGVVVVGVLTAGVLAAIFAAIPFSQDKAAQQDLSAVNTAQGVAKTKDGGYLSKPGLLAAKSLSAIPSALSVDLNYDSSSFCASTVSPTGTSFKVTARQGTPAAGDCQPLWTRQTSLLTTSYWFGTASSSDGNTLLAFNNGPGIRLSKDSGLTWTSPSFASTLTIYGVAVSGNGKVMLAGTSYGAVKSLYVSTDAGTTWTPQPYSVQIATGQTVAAVTVATSADGATSLIAVADNSWRISRDFGSTWSTTGPPPLNSTRSVSVSNDGTKLAITDMTRQWVSVDSGVTWRQIGDSPNVSSLIFSGDGKHLYKTDLGTLLVSDDNGTNWRTLLAVNSETALAISASSNGQTLIAASTAGIVRISKDGGLTWKDQPSVKVNRWVSAAISGNGSVFLAGQYSGALWVGQIGW